MEKLNYVVPMEAETDSASSEIIKNIYCASWPATSELLNDVSGLISKSYLKWVVTFALVILNTVHGQVCKDLNGK